MMNRGLQLFYQNKYNECIQTIPPVLTLIAALTKYVNALINSDKVRNILLIIKADNERYEKLPEYRILDKYSSQARLFVLIFGGYVIFAMVTYLSLPIREIIRDMKNYKNLTDPKLILPLEYNVDHVKYYHAITIHSYSTTVLVVFMIVALDSLFIIVIQHCCILFAVTGFRLKTVHILNKSILYCGDEWKTVQVENFSTEEQSHVFRNIIHSVTEHNRAVQYLLLIHSTYSTTLFFQVFLTIVCMSVSAVEILLNLNKFDVVLGMAVWLVGQEFHLFFLCLCGQRLSDFCENVYYDAIDCTWYTFSSKSKVIYQFLVMNIITPCQLVAMKMMVLNMQTFQAMTRLSASYFTVLSSTL